MTLEDMAYYLRSVHECVLIVASLSITLAECIIKDMKRVFSNISLQLDAIKTFISVSM